MSHFNKSDSITLKVVFIGNTHVGKTSLSQRIKNITDLRKEVDEKEYMPSVYPTVGGAFFRKKELYKNHEIMLDMWDTAGQERFHAIAPIYFHRAQIAVFIFDVDDIYSFHGIKEWKRIFDLHGDKNAISLLVANKIDKSSTILSKIDPNFMIKHGFSNNDMIFTSAKTGEGIIPFYTCILDNALFFKNDLLESTIALTSEQETEIKNEIEERYTCFSPQCALL
jgi:small GTP-binding protein